MAGCALAGLFGAVPQQLSARNYPGSGAVGPSLTSLQQQQQQKQQQEQQQQAALQASWLNSGGFYMGGDRTPQPPPQTTGLGFYTRDSQSLEAELLAQAYQKNTPGSGAAAGSGAPNGMHALLSGNRLGFGQLSEPALPSPGGASWASGGLFGGQQLGAGLPGLQGLGVGLQPSSSHLPPSLTHGALFGNLPGSFPQQPAADQTAEGLGLLRSASGYAATPVGQQSLMSGTFQGTPILGNQQLQQQLQLHQQQVQQQQQQQNLGSLTNQELQQQLAILNAGGGGLGSGWATPAGGLGVGVTTSAGTDPASSLSVLKQVSQWFRPFLCVHVLRAMQHITGEYWCICTVQGTSHTVYHRV